MRVEAAHPGAVEKVVAVQRVHDPPLDPTPLQVELQAGSRQPLGAKGERLVERREVRCKSPQTIERAPPNPAAARTVADLTEVVRVREHERPVHEVENVELEHVAAELDRKLESAQRVLRRERRRAAVTDTREVAVLPPELDQAVRLTTTTAQSSASSPRANDRQSSSTTRARAPGDSFRCSDSARSRRSRPYNSPSRRASMTPSV